MKIVIIGDGKVGYKLAKQLSEENYDIVMIDSNAKKLKEAMDKLTFSVLRETASARKYRGAQMYRMPIL